MNETTKFQASEIFDVPLLSVLNPIFEILSVINIILTLVLIFIIIKATPKYMKSFKFYLLQYAFATLILEFVLALCMPLMLHPFFYVYPAGISTPFHPNLTFLILLIGFCAAISALDCCIVMTLKRYFALQAHKIESTNIPFYVYSFLTFTNICVFIASQGVIYLKPMVEVFRVLPENVPTIISAEIEGLETILNIHSIIIFKSTALSSFPIFIVCGIIFVSIRLILALISLFLNIKSSKSIKIKISIPLQKRNEILRLLTYIQFSGFFFLLCIPIGIIIGIYYFIKQPCNVITFCIIIMNTFGMYDTILTTLFVKPYRMYFIQIFRTCFKGKSQVTVSSVARNSIRTNSLVNSF